MQKKVDDVEYKNHKMEKAFEGFAVWLLLFLLLNLGFIKLIELFFFIKKMKLKVSSDLLPTSNMKAITNGSQDTYNK